MVANMSHAGGNVAESSELGLVAEDEDALENPPNQQVAMILPEQAGQRLDHLAAQHFQEYSRENLKRWLSSGDLQVDGKQVKPSYRVRGGERLTLTAPERVASDWTAQAMPLEIVYEDEAVWVVNKPAGLIVHPGNGHPDGTLVNGLLALDAQQALLPRAGLVHRLDKDTSGLLVVARTLSAQQHLSQQLLNKSVYRVYDALVWGKPPARGTVEAPIGRHPVDRTRMAVVATGRPAVSHFRRIQTWEAVSWVRVQLQTGRTHQIRVHMTQEGWPLVGDPTYGRKNPPRSGLETESWTALVAFPRQALHARELGFIHPVTGQAVRCQAKLPADFQQLLDQLSAQAVD